MTNRDQQAHIYKQALSPEIADILHQHGLSREILDRACLGWDGQAITVPVREKTGAVTFFEYWWISESGEITLAPIQPELAPGLSGWAVLRSYPQKLVVAQGILERLVLLDHGIPAIAATLDGLRFQEEWTAELRKCGKITVCFTAGREADAMTLALKLPHARTATLPHGIDSFVSYFVDCGGTASALAEDLGLTDILYE